MQVMNLNSFGLNNGLNSSKVRVNAPNLTVSSAQDKGDRFELSDEQAQSMRDGARGVAVNQASRNTTQAQIDMYMHASASSNTSSQSTTYTSANSSPQTQITQSARKAQSYNTVANSLDAENSQLDEIAREKLEHPRVPAWLRYGLNPPEQNPASEGSSGEVSVSKGDVNRASLESVAASSVSGVNPSQEQNTQESFEKATASVQNFNAQMSEMQKGQAINTYLSNLVA